MASIIFDMPRKWQKVGRIRGIALSEEKFQFIFQYEHDLLEILEKGVQTYNEWKLAIERWVESPPSNFLQFVPLWVQIKRIPVNHNMIEAITALGALIGQVIEVAYDPIKPQSKGYVRVRVKFDVSRPLRRSKVVNFPKGGSTSVLFDYERVQKCAMNVNA